MLISNLELKIINFDLKIINFDLAVLSKGPTGPRIDVQWGSKPPILPLRLTFLYGTFLFRFFGQKPLVYNQFSIFKPPRPPGVDNIQGRISGLSFGVARELFSEFRS